MVEVARIRSIKPEFWSSPSLPKDPWTRLLYMAMWNWADDNGIGTANERELIGFAFPNDGEITLDEFRRMLVEIHRVFGVIFYTVEGRRFYSISSWEKHQKFDRRSKGRNPHPEDAETLIYQCDCAESWKSHECPPKARRDVVAGTEEQRNRGTEEKNSCATPLREPDRFDEFWSEYPRRRDRRKAVLAYGKALKRSNADAIIAGAQRYAADPNREDQFTKYAEGWLNGDCWLDEPLPARVGRQENATEGALDVLAMGQELLTESDHEPPKEILR
ncbi:hypothetical protein R3Q06_18045 [Rhodococcus erythropolis]|uniref:hypothetical protein n=1 Tax=Rhodococcus erythropolis TaxID=1833 RepID=UPI002949B181|nr:hypothetical protein [Rhodococcus erythropolis]MDV6275400.1 hypothetical protein [Rhodococcus erythropolis]